jgi:hypothetical protein
MCPLQDALLSKQQARKIPRSIFMEMPAMLPVRSPVQRPSNNPVATERAIDALLPISGAALGSAAFGCAVRKTSSRLLRPLRTYPSRQVRCPTAATTAHGVRCVSGICVSADTSTPKLFASASANQRPRNGLADRLGTAVRRHLQRTAGSSHGLCSHGD